MNKFFLIILLFPLIIFSQSKIKGTIVNQDNKPIELIEVLLLSKDSVALKNSYTDSKGKFEIGFKDDSYILEVRQLGARVKVQSITLNKFLDLGEIKVTEYQQQLKEVIVNSNKKVIERKVDRVVFNIENSIAASGGDALDALKVAPGIRVQNEAISMVGKSGVGLMVDDRLIQLAGDDLINYLKTIPSDNIKSIEIITTPPAKYDAEGNSGIINIKLKKPKNDSWSASFRNTIKQATYLSDNVGGNFSFQKKKFSLLADVGFNKSKTIYQNDISYNYPASFWDVYLHNVNRGSSVAPSLTLSYKISEKTTFGLQYIGAMNKPDINDHSNTNVTNKNTGVISNKFLSEGSSTINYSRTSLNANGMTKFNDKGKLMSFDLDYLSLYNKKNNLFNSQILNNNLSVIQNDDVYNQGNLDIKNYAAKIDFTLPTKFANYEYGGKTSFIVTNSNVNLLFYDNIANTDYLTQNINFNYRENTQALYFSANKKLKKWEFKAGLRIENTQTKGFSQEANQTNKTNYFKFFPTIYSIYNPNDNNSFALIFNRRISRPGYEYVNPARRYSSINSYVYGNPFLQPSFSYNFELQHSYKDIFTSSITYTSSVNTISQIIIPKFDNTQVATWENYADYREINFNESINYKINNWWSTVSNVYINYREFESKLDFIQQNGSGWAAGFEIRNSFIANKSKTFLIEGSYWYDTPSKSMERQYSSVSSLDLTFKHFFLEKNLQLTLAFSNILKSDIRKVNYITNGVGLNSGQYYDTRAIKFTIFYKFGNSKIGIKQRRLGNQEEIQRSN